HIADLMEHDPHLQARDFFASVSHTILGDIPISDLPMRLSATPGAYSSAGPCLGEHNAYVYGDLLGMTDTDIATYTAQGIFN
ncbi:MAG: CoA transferase, partial [Candidatus Tectomicrobia bacterium]|nr:CoA transferase [Candidatus Tectomicrobia bacterium]